MPKHNDGASMGLRAFKILYNSSVPRRITHNLLLNLKLIAALLNQKSV